MPGRCKGRRRIFGILSGYKKGERRQIRRFAPTREIGNRVIGRTWKSMLVARTALLNQTLTMRTLRSTYTRIYPNRVGGNLDSGIESDSF